MVIVRFRSKEEHKDLLKKVKKMKEYAEMIEDCIEDSIEDDEEDDDYRYRGNYHREDEEMNERRGGGRYGYRRGRM